MSTEYAPETDRKGRSLHPGDRVRFKLYPRGTAEGIVVVSKRAFVIVEGRRLPALAIDADGTLYSLHSKGVIKLNASVA